MARLDDSRLSMYQEAITGYIAGYIVRNLINQVSCNICAHALVDSTNHSGSSGDIVHMPIPLITPDYLRLIESKNRGGLLYPSISVFYIIHTAEKAFRLSVCGLDSSKLSNVSNINNIIAVAVQRRLATVGLFPSLSTHDLEHDVLTEDMHSTQLCKQIMQKYVTLRLVTYGKHFTKTVIQKNKAGIRQQSNKLVLFRNL